MQIELENATPLFFPKPTFEQIYFESVHNALDANANKVWIEIKLPSFERADELEICIRDNGEGFTEKNFSNFSKLLSVEGNDHKGLGRLVYLSYFKNAEINSYFEQGKYRSFTFDSKFKGSNQIGKDVENEFDYNTEIKFKGFRGKKIKAYKYITPEGIWQNLRNHFFTTFYNLKKNDKKIDISIQLEVEEENLDKNFSCRSQIFTLNDLPILDEIVLENNPLELHEEISVFVSIVHDIRTPRSLTCSLDIDGSVMPFNIVQPDSIPSGYQAMFIFSSNSFIGKVNTSRQKVEFKDEQEEIDLKNYIREQVDTLLKDHIPKIIEVNQNTINEVENNLPHLAGLNKSKEVGLVSRSKWIITAQEEYFRKQRKVLEASNSLDKERYEEAIECSSRALLEYILYRQKIITTLKEVSKKDTEYTIHNLISPRFEKKKGEPEDLFTNNVWILDDKYMSYDVCLSDRRLEDLIKFITEEDVDTEGEPDIALVFSDDPETTDYFDVVIIELKKKGLKLAKNEEVFSQLKQRARRLLKYYPNKISRMWFYGVTEFEGEFVRSLKEGGFKRLYSKGTTLYNSQTIYLDDFGDESFEVDMFIQDYETLVSDAECRNDVFMRVLKSRINAMIKGRDAV